jgi:hypothetical protein
MYTLVLPFMTAASRFVPGVRTKLSPVSSDPLLGDQAIFAPHFLLLLLQLCLMRRPSYTTAHSLALVPIVRAIVTSNQLRPSHEAQPFTASSSLGPQNSDTFVPSGS